MKPNRFASYGLESADSAEIVETPLEDLPPADVVESDMADASAEVQTHENNIAEMTDVAESLEAICVGLECAIAQGGLTKQSAAFALQSADLQLSRVGLEALSVGLEAFDEPVVVEGEKPAEGEVTADNKTSAEPDAEPVTKSEEAGVAGVAVAEASLEGIQETIQNIWKAILAAMEKVRVALKKFFVNMFDFAPRIRAKAQDLRNRAEVAKKGSAKDGAQVDVGGKSITVKGKTVSMGGYLKSIHVGGKLPDFRGALGDLKAVATDVYEAYPKAARSYADKVASELSKADLSKNIALVSAVGSINTIEVPTLKAVGSDGKSKELPGGVKLVQSTSSEGAADGKAEAKKISFAIESVGEAKIEGDGKMAPLSYEDIVFICDEVAMIATKISTYRRDWQQTEAAKDKLAKAGSSLSAKASKAGSDVKQADVNKLLQTPKVAAEVIDAPNYKFSGYLLRTCKALLGAAEQSLGAYEAPAAKEEKAA